MRARNAAVLRNWRIVCDRRPQRDERHGGYNRHCGDNCSDKQRGQSGGDEDGASQFAGPI